MLHFPSPPHPIGDDFVFDAQDGRDQIRVRVTAAAIRLVGLVGCKVMARKKYTAEGVDWRGEIAVTPADFASDR